MGSRIEEVKYFKSLQEARDFCKEFNSRNTSETVPDWYMVAKYTGKKNLPQFN